jgi:hypothetical protein
MYSAQRAVTKTSTILIQIQRIFTDKRQTTIEKEIILMCKTASH